MPSLAKVEKSETEGGDSSGDENSVKASNRDTNAINKVYSPSLYKEGRATAHAVTLQRMDPNHQCDSHRGNSSLGFAAALFAAQNEVKIEQDEECARQLQKQFEDEEKEKKLRALSELLMMTRRLREG